MIHVVMKKKIASIVSTATTALLAFPPIAFAQSTAPGTPIDPCVAGGVGGSSFSRLCSLGGPNLGATIGSIVNFIFVVATIGALFYLIWGGIKWLMSEGDKTAVDAARQHIVSAIIGLIIVFLSYFILNFILMFFTGFSFSALTIPKIGL